MDNNEFVGMDKEAIERFCNIALDNFNEIISLSDDVERLRPYVFTVIKNLREANLLQKKKFLLACRLLCQTSHVICIENNWNITEVEDNG